MVRLTKPTTPVQLEQTINNVILANPGVVNNLSDLLVFADSCLGADVLDTDLSAGFQFENVMTKKDTQPSHPLYSLLGTMRLKQVTIHGVLVGQDYGTPFYLILYIGDRNDLRAYIPEKGNAINPFTGHLFGEGYPEDDLIAQKLGHQDYASMDYGDPAIQDQFYDKSLLIHDIITNIKLKH